MFPEIPADLSALSDEELAELERRCIEFATTAGAGTVSDETLAQLGQVAEGVERIRAEAAARFAAAEAATTDAQRRQDEAAAALARINAPAAETPPETPPGDPQPPDAPPETPPETQPVDVAAIAAAATEAALRALTADGGPLARPAPVELPSLDSMRGHRPPEQLPEPTRPTVTIVASADIPGVAAGSELPDLRGIADAVIRRRESIGRPGDVHHAENVIVASVLANFPEERLLRTGHDADNARKLAAIVSHEAITAAGGLCAPLQPYYEIMTLATAVRPVRDALPGFGADRGGINFVPPPQMSDAGTQARTVADGVTNSTTTVTSATAAFDARDVGASISGAGIPAGAYIVTVTNATTVVISVAATASASGVTLTITRLGTTGFITAAQDAAALGGTQAQIVAATKPCLHVTCPAPVTRQLAAISRCLEFGNFTARAYPEQVEAWLTLAMAQWARRGETALLDRLSALSTQVTAAKTYGAARQLVGQIVKAAAYYRNRNRMAADVVLRTLIPAWVLDAMVADVVHGSGQEMEFFSQARQQVTDALAEVNVRPSFYLDSGTGKGQLVNGGAQQTAGALTAFPGTAVWYLFAEGTFLFLDGGSLDFGVVRDSSLNSLNNYRVFSETFEEAVMVGPESLEVTSTIVADGSAAANLTPIGAF